MTNFHIRYDHVLVIPIAPFTKGISYAPDRTGYRCTVQLEPDHRLSLEVALMTEPANPIRLLFGYVGLGFAEIEQTHRSANTTEAVLTQSYERHDPVPLRRK
jgi:hypothetical protein